MLRNLNRSSARGRICGTPHSGVRGSEIPSDGEDGAAYAYNDLSLPEDADKEICGRITKWPAAGKLFANEDTGFTFTDAPDGLHTFQYQLCVDGVDIGSPVTVALVVGDSAVVATAAWTEADDVIAIAAEVAGQDVSASAAWVEDDDHISISARSDAAGPSMIGGGGGAGISPEKLKALLKSWERDPTPKKRRKAKKKRGPVVQKTDAPKIEAAQLPSVQMQSDLLRMPLPQRAMPSFPVLNARVAGTAIQPAYTAQIIAMQAEQARMRRQMDEETAMILLSM